MALFCAEIWSGRAAGADSPPAAFRNSIGAELVLIPGADVMLLAEGDILMGNEESVDDLMKAFPNAQREWIDDARQHPLRIGRSFYLGKYEVTVGEFKRFAREAGYVTEAEKDEQGGWGFDDSEKKFKQSREFSWRNTGWPQTDSHPVLNVTWNDATAYCVWLSRKEKKEYRLPTEAEWEYACRAGTKTRFHNGSDPEKLAEVANVADVSFSEKVGNSNGIAARDGYAFSAPVGKFKPNRFGLYDMHGNAWEWCTDRYEKDYYDNAPQQDPPGPATGSDRVRRGGGWGSLPFRCRSAFRNKDAPDYRSFDLGFRVALTVSK